MILQAPTNLVGFPPHGLARLPETKPANLPLKNQWLEDEFPFGMAYFQGRTVKNSGVYKYINTTCRYYIHIPQLGTNISPQHPKTQI